MLPFIEKIQRTLAIHNMVTPGDHLVVAVSGGPDSVALLYALDRLRSEMELRLTVAHLDHGTREGASEEDAEFVRQAAVRLGIPVVVEREDVPGASAKSGMSFQETARTIRLKFLESVREQVSAQRVALGHTADDQAETVLINLLRGGGPRGLSGMRPVRGNLIRPLIDCTREDVMEFLKKEKIEFREDATNRDVQYLRNRIRMELLPYLEREYNPQVRQALQQTARILQWEEEHLNREAEDWFERLGREDHQNRQVILECEALKALSPALQARLVRLALERGRGNLRRATFDHILKVLALLESGQSGKVVSLPGEWAAEREADSLKIYKIPESQPGILNNSNLLMGEGCLLQIPGVTSVESLGIQISAEVEKGAHKEPADIQQALLDFDKTGPVLRIRHWRAGDRFQPLGMQGSKKLKDYFKDEKIPRAERKRMTVLTTADDHIIWVLEGRISELYRISEQTRNTLNIRVLK
ncbi:tRNA lysidine(34) synthetase TilS [Nitrospina sp. 32_T5]|uniref:tRNA lysidine(34) synthetase TilS n=1 Tax=unclassified Nitrospina TaxID=2638683 RepID=UPI003F97A464